MTLGVLDSVWDRPLFLCDLFDTEYKTLHQVQRHQCALQHLCGMRTVSLLVLRGAQGKRKESVLTWCWTSGDILDTCSCFTIILFDKPVDRAASLASGEEKAHRLLSSRHFNVALAHAD